MAVLTQDLLGATKGMHLKRQRMQPETEWEHHAELKINLELTGQFLQLSQFLKSLNQLPRLINIQRMKLESFMPEGQQPEVQLEVDVSVYRRLQ